MIEKQQIFDNCSLTPFWNETSKITCRKDNKEQLRYLKPVSHYLQGTYFISVQDEDVHTIDIYYTVTVFLTI